MNVSGLKSVPRCLPDMVCMTLNESTATPHASGKTKSQPKTNNRKDSLPMWVKLTTTSGRSLCLPHEMTPKKLGEPFSELFHQSRFVVDSACESDMEDAPAMLIRRDANRQC